MQSRFKEGIEIISMNVELRPVELLWAARLGGMTFSDDEVEYLLTQMFQEPALARTIKRCAREGLVSSLNEARNRAIDAAEIKEAQRRFAAMEPPDGGMLN